MVAEHPPLSEGFLQRVLGSDASEVNEKPILQVMGFKPLNNGERFRLLVSDGIHCNPYAMLATQLNELIKNNNLNRHAIIRLNKHICNTMTSNKGADGGPSQRRILILLELDVLHDGTGLGPIGEPIYMNQDGTLATTNPTAGAGSGAVKRPMSPPKQIDQPKPKAPAPYAQPARNTAAQPARNTAAQPARNPGSSFGSSGNREAVVPITMLTPYSNNWCLRARVTQKADVRTYANSRGEGKLFSMTLADETGEIRITFFNEAVDRCFDTITTGAVYYVKGGRLKAANKQFSSVKNEYEITADMSTEITPCDEDTGIPKTSFNFVKIKDLANMPPDSMIDIIGVVKSATDATTFTAKSQKEFTKRELVLVDDTKTEINLTLWGDTAVKFDPTDQPVVAIKGAKVSDFGGRSLSTTQSSTILTNPAELREAQVLRGWFDDVGKFESASTLSTGRSGSGGGGVSGESTCVENAKLPMRGEDTRYATVYGHVVAFREANAVYKSCGIDDCKKKVLDNGDGTFTCPKCNRPGVTTFTYRYTLSAYIRDCTGGLWVTFFDEQGKELLGCDANELGNLVNQGDASKGKQVFQDGLFKLYAFRFRSKMENYNDEAKLRTNCAGITKINLTENTELVQKEVTRMCNLMHISESSLERS